MACAGFMCRGGQVCLNFFSLFEVQVFFFGVGGGDFSETRNMISNGIGMEF